VRVIGLLSWYDEQAGHLTDAVISLGRAGVDHVVAVDGAYALYPDASNRSGSEQHAAIRDAAGWYGMGATIHTPPEPWAGNEVEKRSAMFALGHAHADPHEDWLLVIDADEKITVADGWRDQLERTSLDVGAVLHGEPGVRPRSERRLFRAHPQGIQVRGSHFFYVDGDERVLWGPGQIDRELVELRMLHRPQTRTAERTDARNAYYEYRLQANAELAPW
jgi:hypothetical protein